MYTHLHPGEMRKTTVAIVGAGVSGCAIARVLSAFDLDVVLIEKEADVCFGTSKANSGIVHGGFHHNNKYLKTQLEIEGNLLFDKLHRELDFPYNRCGILVAAMHNDELKHVEYLYQQGVDNGSIGIEMCSRSRILELEPKLHPDVVGGLHAPMGGMIEPYRFGFALAESAAKNGVTIITDFAVERAEQAGPGPYGPKLRLFASNGSGVEAEMVINAAGIYADKISSLLGAEEFTIKARKGEYYLLDRDTKAAPRKVLFPVPTHVSKGMLVIPTVEGTVLIGPTADEIDDKEDTSTTAEQLELIFDSARRLVPSISAADVITSFSGVRPAMDSNDFYIQRSQVLSSVIQVAGIQSPGLTASPAIGEYVKNLVKEAGVPLREKTRFQAKLTRLPSLRTKSIYEADAIAQENPEYCRIVCRCETVTQAEIRQAVRAGHTTMDGVKFATRAGAGRCQGGFCSYKVFQLIAEESGLSPEEISKHGSGSELFQYPIGDFADVIGLSSTGSGGGTGSDSGAEAVGGPGSGKATGSGTSPATAATGSSAGSTGTSSTPEVNQ